MKKLVFSVLISLNVLCSPLWAQIPSDGLVAWYPFNGNANDESGNGNHGTVNGATLTTDRFGNANGAYSFDGNSQNIIVANSDELNPSAITISVWYLALGNNMCVISKNNPLNALGFSYNIKHQDVFFSYLGLNTGWGNGSCNAYSANEFWGVSNQVPSNEWVNIVLTIDPVGLGSVFKNGVLLYVNQGSALYSCNEVSSILKFGGPHWNSDYEWFNGKIDDISIYNRALSATEIQQLFQDQTGQVQQPLTCNITAPTTSLCAGESVALSVNITGGAGASSQLPANLQQGLVAYYPFNGNANDESGNGNDGVVNGAALTSDRFGSIGNAYQFNGTSDYILCSNSNLPFGNSSRTFSAWFKLSQSQGYSDWYSIFSYGGNDYYGELNDILVGNLNESSIELNTHENFYQTPILNGLFDSWQHLVVTYSNESITGVSIYLNGTIVQNVNVNNAGLDQIQTSNSNPLMIGRSNVMYASNFYFNGLLDDMAIYNRALSPSEIQQLYTSQSFTWSTGATTPTITVTPSESTTYTCSIVQDNATCTASLDIVVNPTVTNAISVTILEGQSYTLGTQTLTTAGTYTEVFTSAAGCDSTVTLALSVEPLSCQIQASTQTICGGSSAVLTMTSNAFQSNVPLTRYVKFSSTYSADNGQVNVYGLQVYDNGVNVALNRPGYANSYEYGDWNSNGRSALDENFNGSRWSSNRNDPGPDVNNPHYLVVDLGSLMAIDSILLNIQGFDSWSQDFTVSISSDEMDWWEVGSGNHVTGVFEYNLNEIYMNEVIVTWSSGEASTSIQASPTETTDYTAVLYYGNQTCTDNFQLTVTPEIQSAVSATIASGETYLFGNTLLSSPGVYVQTFTSVGGCDSIVTLTLSNESLICNISAPVTTICQGESLVLTAVNNGNTQSETWGGNLLNGPFTGGNISILEYSAAQGATIYQNNNLGTSCSENWRPYGTFCDEAPTNNNHLASYRTNFNAGATWNSGSGGYGILVVDLQDVKTFNALSAFQMYSDGKLTQLSMFYWPAGNLEAPASSSQNWVSVFQNQNISAGSNQNNEVTNPTIFEFNPLQSRYLMFHCYNDGTLGQSAWIEVRSLKLFNKTINNTSQVLWSNGEVASSITVMPSGDATYGYTVTQGNETCTASVDITVNPNVTNAISATIIEGETFTLGTQTLTTAGTYTEVFTSAAGCDSTVTLTLAVESALNCTINATNLSICGGESVNLEISTQPDLIAQPELLETFTMSFGSYFNHVTSFSTEIGTTYMIKISGVYTVWCCNPALDAAYYFANASSGNAVQPQPQNEYWYFNGQFFGRPVMDVFNPSHEYIYYVQGNGENWSFVFWDGAYGDNSGHLDFEIYKVQQVIEWSTGATTSSITVSPTTNTTYSCTVTQGLQTCTASVDITVTPQQTFYADNDGDGFGDENVVVQDCNQPAGYVADNTDCNDNNNAAYPGAEEICFNQIDDNCNGQVDENCAIFGCINPNACNYNPLANTDDGSCILPQPEVCNNLDDNCNNQVDEGLSFVNYYNDNDGDGQGTGNAINACTSPGASFVTATGDCNDNNSTINSNAVEVCDNVDNNCNALVDDGIAFVNYYFDNDGDGQGAGVVINACVSPGLNYVTMNGDCDDNNASINSNAVEICNGLDNDCDGQIANGLSSTDINAVNVNTALYPACSAGNLFSANLNNGVNTLVINGAGPDLWYRLTAQHNALRASLSAATGNNSVGIYQDLGGCLVLITEENEATTGNQVLLTDDLQVGDTYYIAVHQIAGSSNASAKICFNHLVATTCDHVYSGNTGVYGTVCSSFKAQYKANVSQYIFNVLSATQNGSNLNITPWSYSTPTSSSIITRLGTLLPANMSASNKVYTLSIPVTYGLYDAANNLTLLTANATSTCTVTLQPEAGVMLRTSDRCPATKAINQSIATDRSICGALRYEWEFTQTAPTAGLPVTVLSGLNSTALFLNTVPGMANGKTYNVRVRPIHTTGEVGNYGAVQCMKTTGAGMVMEDHPGSAELLTLSMMANISLFPNPTVDGQVTLMWKEFQEGTKEMTLRDVQGRVVWKEKVVMEGNMMELDWKALDTGIYLLEVDGETMRVIKG
jgi:hypothetical protein